MVVREEDLAELDQADVRPQQLALRALAAVEEQPVAAAPDEQRRRRALRGRHGAGSAEEDEVEIHTGSLGGGRAGPRRRRWLRNAKARELESGT